MIPFLFVTFPANVNFAAMSKILNIGILAHVDAGKTSLTEQLLVLSGSKAEAGSVDKGSATTDQLPIEKQRGISVRTANVSFNWKDVQLNIIDTPGHADFIAEVERSLQILDCAILVISAVEGLQSNTYILYETLKELKIPFIIFVNKADRAGANTNEVLRALKTEFNSYLFPLNMPVNEAENKVSLLSFSDDGFGQSPFFQTSIESIAEFDEEILKLYLEEQQIEKTVLKEKAVKQFEKLTVIPLLCGSAKNNLGIKEILNIIINFAPVKNNLSTDSTKAIVFKIEHHPKFGKLSHVKIIQGVLSVKDSILIGSTNEELKIPQLKKQYVGKLKDTNLIATNDIGMIVGQNTLSVGDVLGSKENAFKPKKIKEPLLSTRVNPKNEKDFAALATALTELNIEDPDLNFKWIKEENELILNLHGAIQKEILREMISERFNIDCIFEEPSVIYKETPLKKAEGFVRYWMPKPCWAIMKFEIEPLGRGCGVVYESNVGVNNIHQKYQNEVVQTIHKSLEQGIKGWEVTDLKITLLEGEDHEIHSRPGDFKLATPMGIMKALQNSGTQLLEPMFFFEIIAEETLLGTINSNLLKRRAEINTHHFENGNIKLSGQIPVSTSLDLSIALNSMCSGKVKFRTKFNAYKTCEDSEGIIRPFKGVNPLDESLWILHMRGAYK